MGAPGPKQPKLLGRLRHEVIHLLAHCAGEIVVAYEPVWAIGTGRTATPEQAQQVHAVLRAQLQAATGHAETMKIIYGGSVNPDNTKVYLGIDGLNGLLVGGASLNYQEFAKIIQITGELS